MADLSRESTGSYARARAHAIGRKFVEQFPVAKYRTVVEAVEANLREGADPEQVWEALLRLGKAKRSGIVSPALLQREMAGAFEREEKRVGPVVDYPELPASYVIVPPELRVPPNAAYLAARAKLRRPMPAASTGSGLTGSQQCDGPGA